MTLIWKCCSKQRLPLQMKFFLYSILIETCVIPMINNSGKVGRAVDFNAILIVAVENWLWELHDVEYHGVHLINLSKSSRFVSVNHMSERQKTGAERRKQRVREKTIFYSDTVQTNQKTMWTHNFSVEKIDFSVSNVWSNDTCPIIREKREMSKMPLTHEQIHVIPHTVIVPTKQIQNS